MRRFLQRLILALLWLAGMLTAFPAQSSSVAAQSVAPLYLIITPDAFASALTDFITVQQERGFQVQLVLLSQTGTEKEQIKNYIQRLFPRPKYVLLVGDNEFIPTWPFTTFAIPPASTDLYYTTFTDNSYRPKTILGRLPVHNTTDLTDYMSKLIAYYHMAAIPSWQQQISFIATDHPTFAMDTEDDFNYIIATDTTPTGYSGTFTGRDGAIAPTTGGDRLFPLTYNANSDDVVSIIGEGRAAVVYLGSGSPTSWDWNAGPFLSVNQVRTFSGPPIPLVLALAHKTADFATAESMADAWILNAQSGALVYIGASADTQNNSARALANEFFNTEFYDFSTPRSVGEALQASLLYLDKIFYTPPGGKAEYERYQLFGDPSLTFRQPQGARLRSHKFYLPVDWGSQVIIPFSVENPGETAETFELTIHSFALNPVALDVYSVELAPGAATVVYATVQMSTDYPVGASDNITLTATQHEPQPADELIKTKITVSVQTFDPAIPLPLVKRSNFGKPYLRPDAAVGIIQ
ncbi:MAG: C25 family cysteine peptidase [Bellilinea sp.]